MCESLVVQFLEVDCGDVLYVTFDLMAVPGGLEYEGW
jgi:hypothetical protein